MRRLLAVLCLLLSLGTTAGATPRVGDGAPDFQLTTLDGKKVRLSSLRGKVVVLNFFATWCPTCIQELPHLESQVWQGLKAHKDLEVLVVGREETAEKLNAFRKKAHLTIPMAPDPKREVYRLYAEKTIPRTFVINRQGKIVHAVEDYNEATFQELLTRINGELNTH